MRPDKRMTLAQLSAFHSSLPELLAEWIIQ
jgi:hypothetical protein